MKKIPTADEFLEKNIDYDLPQDCYNDVERAMIEFAKLHVEAALKEASQKAETKEDVAIFAEGTFTTRIIDRDSILNSYSLENIK